jgi:hypothetical protein
MEHSTTDQDTVAASGSLPVLTAEHDNAPNKPKNKKRKVKKMFRAADPSRRSEYQKQLRFFQQKYDRKIASLVKQMKTATRTHLSDQRIRQDITLRSVKVSRLRKTNMWNKFLEYMAVCVKGKRGSRDRLSSQRH